MTPTSFPPPWTYKDLGHAWECRDASGFALTWFHYDERQIIGTAPRMTRDQARRFAANFCKLPELLKDRPKP